MKLKIHSMDGVEQCLVGQMAKHCLRRELMWYVIQTYSGREEYCKTLIEKSICKNIIEDCRIPVYVQMKKKGEWFPETRVMFPGYLFIRTQDITGVYMKLKSIPKMTKLIGIGKEIIPISIQEERLLSKMGGCNMVIDISKGIIEYGKVSILSGPLQGMEGNIKKINRHKRLAWVDISMFGREIEVPLGLEILEVT